MSFYDAIRVGASGAADFEIERSLRFNDGDSAFLTRTPSSNGNRQIWTFSVWLKHCFISSGAARTFFSSGSSNPDTIIKLDSDRFEVSRYYSAEGGYTSRVTSTRVLRDPSAWYHLVGAVDTTQGTASNRVKLYVNGTQVTDFDNSSYPAQNFNYELNSTSYATYVGKHHDGQFFDGYLAEFNFVDGQQLTPSSFAETNTDTGQWVPKDTSALTFGTNGFRLKFADNSGTSATTLGKDSSGNGNNLTPNNFSVSAGTGNDSLEDTPTNNFPTLNPLAPFGSTAPSLSNGNLDFTMTSNNMYPMSTFTIPKSGKWYAEVVFTADSISQATVIVSNPVLQQNSSGANRHNGINYYGTDILVDNSGVQSSVTAVGLNTTIGICVDRDAGTVLFKNNNSNVGVAVNLSSVANIDDLVFAVGRGSSSGSNITGYFNFGQRPFTYTPPTGFKALNSKNLPDPTILLSNKHFDTLLYTGNGATSSRAITGLNFSPNWVWLKNRESTYHHQLHDTNRGTTGTSSSGGVLYSNNTQVEDNTYSLASFDSNGFSISKDNNQQGQNNNGDDYVAWNWNAGDTDSATYRVVVVSDSGNKYRFRNSANTATFAQSAVTLDLAEGGTYTFDQSDSTMSSHPMKLSTTANGTHGGGSSYNTGVTYELDGSTVTESAFVSGFSSATSRKLIITVAASAPTLYYFCHYHSGMGGQANTNSTIGSSNFDGTIQSTVKTNASAGFSIVTYTGTGADGTIGHGLGAIPDVAITKKRSATQDWLIKHSAVSGKVGYLNLADQFDNSGSGGGIISDFSSSLNYSITRYNNSGNYGNVNESSATYVAYVFSAVKGYSKFGSYTGNNSSNGPFIFTGFKPAFILSKAYDSSSYWYEVVDNKRVEFNPRNKTLYANASDAEYSGSQYDKDLLSNGFKARGNNAGQNGSFNYIYIAFAESPFKNNRAE